MRLKINYKIITAFIVLSVCCAPTTDAQIWKRLKKKAKEKLKKTEDKLINKLDKKTDKVIDSTLNGTKKPSSEKKIDNNFKSYGNASVSHSSLDNFFNVKDLSKTKVSKEGNKFKFVGYWVTVGVDVFDGYVLRIKDINGIDALNTKKTFKIPEEASLELAYNASVSGRYSYDQEAVIPWQKYNLESGTVTVNFNKDKNVSISFTGNGIVRKYSARDQYTEISSGVNGMINTTSPEYRITKEIKKKEKREATKELTESEKKSLLKELSPTINIPGSFSFNKSIEVEITDNRGEKYSVDFLLGNYPDIYGMSVAPKEMQGQGEVTMVMTPKSSTMFMSIAGMKMKKSSSVDQLGDQYKMTDKLPEGSDFAYVKTGNTKTIAGYNCEEYKVDYDYTNSKGSASFWVSKDFPIQNMELPMMGMKLNNPYLSGFVLELNSNHQGQSMTMKVVKVSNKSLTINSSDYKKAGF
jgi:hypothetical protein